MTTAARDDGRGSNGRAGNEAGPRAPGRALLMAGNALAPCIGCTLECFPRSCELFTEWLGLLERSPRGPDGHP
ncbi:MAG: hypothetical protein QXO51_04345 [Halobacteria archaeon]